MVLERLFGAGGRLGDAPLQLIPDPLIRIELGRARWQEEKGDLTVERLDQRLDLLGAMDAMPVDDEEDFALDAVGEAA